MTSEQRDTRIVMIRHGRARCADESIIGGFEGCTGLTAEGRAQVAALRARLERTGELGEIDVVLTSMLPRAVDTAHLLAPALGTDPASVHRDCDLCELHVGEADGLPWDEWRSVHGEAFDADHDRPFAPGGESVNEFADRIERTVRRLADEHVGRTVVVVCHGGVISYWMKRLLGAPDVWFDVENTSLTEWRVGPQTDWALARFNDHAHLLG